MAYQVEANRAESVITVAMDGVTPEWEQCFLLASDVHWDNPLCDRGMFQRHLNQAKERNAGVLVFGDFFCAMQGKYDPRASKESVRPEHQTVNYLDALVDTAAEWLAPYREHIIMIADGNHELSIRKRQETDLLERLCEKLGCVHMGISGFVRFKFQGSKRTTRVLYWHHGYGGGGPVTRGVIQTARRAVYLPDATFVVSGHIHEETAVTIPRQRLSTNGVPYLDEQVHITLPTYKQEFVLSGGWHTETGKPPKPLGGRWLRFYGDWRGQGQVGYETIRAK